MTVSDPLNRARESHFLFFSSEDIQSLLVEVAGDIEQAVTRITEGASSFRFFSIFLISFQVLPNSGLSHAKRTRNILPLHTLPKTQLPFVAIPVAEEVVAVVAVGLGEVALQAEVVAVQAEAVQPMGIYPGRERPVQHPLHLHTPSGEQVEKASQEMPSDKPKETNGWTDQSDAAHGGWGWSTETNAESSVPQSHLPAAPLAKTPATSKLSWAQIAR